MTQKTILMITKQNEENKWQVYLKKGIELISTSNLFKSIFPVSW